MSKIRMIIMSMNHTDVSGVCECVGNIKRCILAVHMAGLGGIPDFWNCSGNI